MAALLVVLLGGWFFFQWQLWGIQITVTQVPVTSLPEAFEGLRIVQISDLHGHEYGQDSRELLELVAQQEPDLIAITGDLVDRESQLAMVPALARGLAARDRERYGGVAADLEEKAQRALQRQKEQRRHEKKLERAAAKPWAAPARPASPKGAEGRRKQVRKGPGTGTKRGGGRHVT